MAVSGLAWKRRSDRPGTQFAPLLKEAKEGTMASSSKTTTDHQEIREWAEARGGLPVSVRGTGKHDEPGVLRIDFPGGADSDRLEEISWDEWFEKFDENNLAFLYQEHKADGEESTFFKLISRETAKEKGK
jgi:hypothetical protein